MNTAGKKGQILFYSFIISQPFIDIATGFMTRYGNGVLSIGAIVRALLVVIILPYIWIHLRSRFMRGVLIASIATIGLTAVISVISKSPVFLQQEAVFYMKTLFFVVSILFIYIYVHQPFLPRSSTQRAIVQASYIIGGSYIIALLTRTSFPSYPHGEAGYSGWFFSANELSVITILLFAAVLTITREQRTASSYGALFLLALMGMLIGTKTAYIGVALLLVVQLVTLLRTYKTELIRQKHVILTVLLCFIYFGALPLVPMTANSVQNHVLMEDQTDTEQVQQLSNQSMNNVLSSRQDYVRAIATDFQHASLMRNLFGLGYAGDYESHPKMIEMDFFELFFSFGIIGTIILLTPLLVLVWWLLTRGSLRPSAWVLLAGFGLSVGVAAVAGHVFFAPSVMSYAVVCAALLENKTARMENG